MTTFCGARNPTSLNTVAKRLDRMKFAMHDASLPLPRNSVVNGRALLWRCDRHRVTDLHVQNAHMDFALP